MNHEHIIGEVLDYDDTRLVTLSSLKEHIKQSIAMAELMNGPKVSFLLDPLYGRKYNVYSLADYCDGRRSTDLRRFNFCPVCGEKIDWKAMKEVRG